MSTKKNLTVAALAALLAVPAFNETNVSHALHIPSVTAHADESNEPYFDWHTGTVTQPTYAFNTSGNKYEIPAGTPLYGVHGGIREDKPGWTSAYVGAPLQNDSYIPEDAISGSGYRTDGQGYLTDKYIIRNGSTSSTINNTNTQDNTINSESNNNTQYTSQSGKLPQTNENNGASNATILGAVAATAGVGLTALSFAEKHRNLAKENVDMNTVNAADGKGHNKSGYSNKSNYDMIMSDTFANLSKSLKNL